MDDNNDMLAQVLMLAERQIETIELLKDQVNGLGAVHQIILEVLLSVSPHQKAAVAEACKQILEHPGAMQHEHGRELLRNILEVTTRPSRTTPEGRRSWLHLVPAPTPRPSST